VFRPVVRQPQALQHLGGSQHLPKTLVLAKEESPLAAVVEARKDYRTADGKTELIAYEWWDSAGLSEGPSIEKFRASNAALRTKEKIDP